MKYYSVFQDNTFIESNTIEEAIAKNPRFIIGLAPRGNYTRNFPERDVDDSHFYIYYYNPYGERYNFKNKGWRVKTLDDPIRYNTHIKIVIADPTGEDRIFDKWNTDCHYSIQFRNTIDGCDGLILLYDFFQELSEYPNWRFIEKLKYEDGKFISYVINQGMSSVVGNLHPYSTK